MKLEKINLHKVAKIILSLKLFRSERGTLNILSTFSRNTKPHENNLKLDNVPDLCIVTCYLNVLQPAQWVKDNTIHFKLIHNV